MVRSLILILLVTSFLVGCSTKTETKYVTRIVEVEVTVPYVPDAPPELMVDYIPNTPTFINPSHEKSVVALDEENILLLQETVEGLKIRLDYWKIWYETVKDKQE